MSKRVKRHGLGAVTTALASAFFLGGCAVMRIDVDVYKGPLANDEIVQLQQFQSMAPGMFEVMVQLRDQFEWGDLPVWQCEDGRAEMQFEVESKFGGRKPAAEPCPDGYMRRAIDSNAVFKHPKAVQVNEILTLFENSDRSEAAELARAVGEAIDVYRTAFLTTLEVHDSDKERWTRFSAAMLTAEEFVDRQKTPPADEEAVREKFNAFKERFKRLLDPRNASCRNEKPCPWRTIIPENGHKDGISEAYNALRASLAPRPRSINPFTGTSEDVRLTAIISPISRGLQGSTNISDLFIGAKKLGSSDQRWIDHYADILFGPGHGKHDRKRTKALKEKQKFIGAVENIARSFFVAREAIRKLWDLSLEGLFRLQKIAKDDFQREQLRSALASLLSTVTNPRRVTVAAFNENANRTSVARGRRLEMRIQIHPNLTEDSTISDVDPKSYDRETVRQNIRNLLVENTNETVSALFSLDDALTHDFSLSTLQGNWADLSYNYKDTISRQYGVARGLSTNPRQLLDASVSIEKTLASVAKKGGLARGRPDQGVFALVESFIEAEQRRRRCKDQECESESTRNAEIARDELSQGLIHFAQKVSSIANHDALLPNGGDIDSFDKKGGNLKFKSNSARFRSAFVPTLQAIGNTFLIQADELEARRRHAQKLNERRKPERLALEYSLSRTPAQVVDDLILDLEARRDAIATGKSSDFATLASTKDALSKKEAELAEKNKLQAGLQSQLETLGKALKTANDKAAPTIFAHRSLHATQQVPLNETFDTGESDLDLTADSAKLLAFLNAAGSQISIDDLKKRVVTWLQGDNSLGLPGQIVAKFPDAPRQKRLVKTLAFFLSELDGLKGSTAIPTANSIAQLKSSIENTYKAALPSVVGATKGRDTAKAALTAEKNAINTLNTEISKLISDEIARLEHTIKVIKARRRAVQMAAERPDEVGDPPNLFRLLKAKIEEDFAEESDNAELKNAQAILALYPLPSGQAEIAALPDRRHEGDRRDVLDDLISSLRYADIEAARSGQGARTVHMQAALKKAYEYRASMVYIRPASSYLRSSYAANSLQGDPTLGWRNMLTRHASRGLPHFISQAINQDDPHTEAIRAELDKQFWQNINSVRVGGGGITNYALIKDDIGNWAIKSFSADPEPIIRAAQSLAMFNLGGSLDTNLLRVNELRSKPNRTEGEQEELNLLTERTSGGGPALKRLFEHHEQRYVEKTEAQLQAFAAKVKETTLQKRVQDAWTQSLQTSGTAGDATETTLRQSLLAVAGSKDAIGEAQNALTEAGNLTAFSDNDDAKTLKKKRKERKKTAVMMGEKLVTALGHVNDYRSKLLSEAGKQLGAKIAARRGEIAETSSAIQSTEKTIAELETTEKNHKAALADLESLKPAEAPIGTTPSPEQEAFKAKIAALKTEIEMLGVKLKENRATLATKQADLDNAKTQLALRETQLRAISAEANRIVGGLILEVTRGRQAAIAAFEQAILFIGDTPDASGDPLLKVKQQLQ